MRTPAIVAQGSTLMTSVKLSHILQSLRGIWASTYESGGKGGQKSALGRYLRQTSVNSDEGVL